MYQVHFGIRSLHQSYYLWLRMYVWWLKLKNQIEAMTKNCKGSSFYCTSPSMELTLHAMAENTHGPFQGQIFLIIVDLTQKWP